MCYSLRINATNQKSPCLWSLHMYFKVSVQHCAQMRTVTRGIFIIFSVCTRMRVCVCVCARRSRGGGSGGETVPSCRNLRPGLPESHHVLGAHKHHHRHENAHNIVHVEYVYFNFGERECGDDDYNISCVCVLESVCVCVSQPSQITQPQQFPAFAQMQTF